MIQLPSGLFVPGPLIGHSVALVGRFSGEILRRTGAVDKLIFPNGVTNVGRNSMLNSQFLNPTQTTYPYWFMGLIGNSSFTAVNATDTMSSHSGWTEDTANWAPTVFAGAVNNGPGYSGGATSMTINGVSQAIANGTPFTVSGSTYTVLSSTGGGTPTAISFIPGLTGSVSNAAAISFGNGRGLWVPGAASGNNVINTTSVNFIITATSVVLNGAFVTSDPTLGGTAGLLWSSGTFGTAQTLFLADTLKLTYSVTLA